MRPTVLDDSPQALAWPTGAAPAAETRSGGGSGGGKPGRRGGGGGGGRQEHQGAWLITYCDMTTLLMAFFICLITFASRAVQDAPRLKDSALYAAGGSGVAGPPANRADRDSIVWRECTVSARHLNLGSAAQPTRADPVRELTAKVLRCLEEPQDRVVAENQRVALPISLLFAADDRLSASGKQVLRFVGSNLRRQPYDVHIQVDSAADLRRALAVCRFLIDEQGLVPGRLAAGVLPAPARDGMMYFTLIKRV